MNKKLDLSINIENKNSTELPSKIENKNLFSITSQPPSVIKANAKDLLTKLDNDLEESENVKNAEELLSLCLFAHNREILLETGIISPLVLGLKTKTDEVKDTYARILQLFAQDSKDNCIQLKHLNINNTCLDILGKSSNVFVKISIVGLLYWLSQNMECKKELNDMGSITYLKEYHQKAKEPLFQQYLNYTINALSKTVKSREELLQEVVNQKIEVSLSKSNDDDDKSSNKTPTTPIGSYSFTQVSPSPRNYRHIFKIPKGKESNSLKNIFKKETEDNTQNDKQENEKEQ